MYKETILVEVFYGCQLNRLHETLLKLQFQLETLFQKMLMILYFVLQKLEDSIGILKDEIIDYGHLMIKHMNGCLEMLSVHHIQN
jgi:hypothetical protein